MFVVIVVILILFFFSQKNLFHHPTVRTCNSTRNQAHLYPFPPRHQEKNCCYRPRPSLSLQRTQRKCKNSFFLSLPFPLPPSLKLPKLTTTTTTITTTTTTTTTTNYRKKLLRTFFFILCIFLLMPKSPIHLKPFIFEFWWKIWGLFLKCLSKRRDY